MPAYTTSPDELAQGLKVDVQGGPTRQDAAERLLRFGANALPDAGRGDSFIRALAGQLRNFLIILLLAPQSSLSR